MPDAPSGLGGGGMDGVVGGYRPWVIAPMGQQGSAGYNFALHQAARPQQQWYPQGYPLKMYPRVDGGVVHAVVAQAVGRDATAVRSNPRRNVEHLVHIVGGGEYGRMHADQHRASPLAPTNLPGSPLRLLCVRLCGPTRRRGRWS